MSTSWFLPAGVTDPGVLAVAARLGYLQNEIDGLTSRNSLILNGQPVAAAVLPNQPVFWNVVSQQFEQAREFWTNDPLTGAFGPAPSSFCLGICVTKTAPTIAAIALGGAFVTNLANATTAPPRPGPYYLASVAGILSPTSAGAPAVLFWDGTDAYVSPRWGTAADHEHLGFQLICETAGVGTLANGEWTIVGNATHAGWLPANDPSFHGLAPTGALFGYNVAADPALAAAWPPLPASSAVLAWDRGRGAYGSSLVPLGFDGLAVVDNAGIWWLTSCDGLVPWAYPHSGSSALPGSLAGDPCPRPDHVRLSLFFTRLAFDASRAAVTSLSPLPGSLVTITDCNGNPAHAGALFLGVQSPFTIAAGNQPGSRVLKGLTGTVATAGEVVEGLLPGPGIALSSTFPPSLPGQPWQGTVTVSLNTAALVGELRPDIVRLDDALERIYPLLYVGLPSGRRSAIHYEFQAPLSIGAGTPAVATFLLYGTTVGAMPTLSLSSSILPFPATTGVGSPVPQAETAVTLATGFTVDGASCYAARSTAIVVNPGDTVFATLSRVVDAYPGEVGVVWVKLVLQSPAGVSNPTL